jgi:hypothetical protein
MPSRKAGICKLTGVEGSFVKSHLLPNALTRQSIPGGPFIQGGDGEAPERRWTSWYDTALVTEEGEAVLSELDNWAIAQLRSHRLVWSGWGPMRAFDEGVHVAEGGWRARN